jgi:hypothetical protein
MTDASTLGNMSPQLLKGETAHKQTARATAASTDRP